MGPSRLRGQTEGSYLEFSGFQPGIDVLTTLMSQAIAWISSSSCPPRVG
jgi:hypothetical protein